MHITDTHKPQNIHLTKCSKMTEEKHRRHGMNGIADRAIKDEYPKASYGQGGRLKFFKDGKFILELERAREGERVSWVSVPRKTFWPPQGTATSTPTYRQESSTSLSVSDDNSSIQSSPWQRDHSWKQTTPHRNLSKEMMFYFWRPKRKRYMQKSKKRRQPYSTVIEELKVLCSNNNNNNNNSSVRTTKDKVCNNNNINVNNKTKRYNLLEIIQNLIDKIITNTPPQLSTRHETVVSPRKRFLREMEKDINNKIDENCQKRSRNKTVTSGGTVSITKINNSSIRLNGTTTTTTAAAVTTTINDDVRSTTATVTTPTTITSRNNSYSITSLLADDRNVIRRSPNNSPSHFNTVVTQPQYCSPSSEDRWYSESVDRLRSIELSQAEKRGFPPYPHPSYVPQIMYPYSLPPYYNPGYIPGRGFMVPPPPPIYPTSPMQLPIRQDAPSCSSWAVVHRDNNTENGEDITDMPLNLSKHAG